MAPTFCWKIILKHKVSMATILNISLTSCVSLRKQKAIVISCFCCCLINNQFAIDLLLSLIPLDQIQFDLWVYLFLFSIWPASSLFNYQSLRPINSRIIFRTWGWLYISRTYWIWNHLIHWNSHELFFFCKFSVAIYIM